MARKWNKTFARADQRDLNQCIACQGKEVSEQKTNQKGTLDKTGGTGKYPGVAHNQTMEYGETV